MRTSPLLALIALTLITLLSASASSAAVFQLTDTTGGSIETMTGTSKWKIDNEYTSVVCAASHYGLSFVYGRFNKCSGTIEMDFQDPASTKFRIEIDPASVDTNDIARDMQLRGPSCLDSAQYTTIIFESTSVKSEDKPAGPGKTKRTFQVTGNLEMHGETRQTTIPIELLAMGNGPDARKRCGFMSRFVINRSDFGIDGMRESVGDSIAVTFCFQAVREEPDAEEKTKSIELKPFDTSTNRFGADSRREKIKELFRQEESTSDGESETNSGQLKKED